MGEVFTTDAVAPATVRLVVNGNDKGTVEVKDGTSIIDFVRQQAQAAGIRTFSVYLNDEKLDTSDASDNLEPDSKVEIVAKDSRG
jgi:hypothetical protein